MSVDSCPKCGSSNFYHDAKTGVNECHKCGNKWKRPTAKELMSGTVLNGSLEAARSKPLTEFTGSEKIIVKWTDEKGFPWSEEYDTISEAEQVKSNLRAEGIIAIIESKSLPSRSTGLTTGNAGERRGGQPRTEEERAIRHPVVISEAVVREEEVSTFAPAFLTQVEEAWRTKSVQSYWEWIMEPSIHGVAVTLRGNTKPHEFFPSTIIEEMKYDPVRETYYVPRTGPPGKPLPIQPILDLITTKTNQEGWAKREDVIAILESDGMEKADLEAAIDQLIRQGTVYSPREGYLRKT